MKRAFGLVACGILLVLVFALSGCGTDPALSSIAITPSLQALSAPGETAQFVAMGTFTKSNQSTNTTDVTSQVHWTSSDVGVATINSAGLATAGTLAGSTTITATSTNGVTKTASLVVSDPGGGGQLPTLAVYAVGPGSGTVTSNPAGINCTSGAGCTGNFQLGATVTLTAAATSGSTYGGWSSNCTPMNANQPTESCTVTMVNNTAVGVIFNH